MISFDNFSYLFDVCHLSHWTPLEESQCALALPLFYADLFFYYYQRFFTLCYSPTSSPVRPLPALTQHPPAPFTPPQELSPWPLTRPRAASVNYSQRSPPNPFSQQEFLYALSVPHFQCGEYWGFLNASGLFGKFFFFCIPFNKIYNLCDI